MERVILPPPVKVGDKVSLIAPSSSINVKWLEMGIALLRSWGLEPVVNPQVCSKRAYVAGSDEERARAIIDAFNDEQTSAVLCVNGGYGSTRLAPFLSPDKLGPHVCSKRFFGFSDVTALHCALRVAVPGYVSFHAPMVATSTFAEAEDKSKEALSNALFGSSLQEACPPIKGRSLQLGRARDTGGVFRGRVVGGNLSLWSSVIGTAWQEEFSNCILLLEDVNEPFYRLDRMVTQILASHGWSEALRTSALALGNFGSAFEDEEAIIKLKGSVDEDVKAWFWLEQIGLPPDLPILIDLPVGHIKDNRVVALGAVGEIDFNSGELRFEDAYQHSL